MSYLSSTDRIEPRLKDPPKKAVGREVPVFTINGYQIFNDEMERLKNGVEIHATIVYAMTTVIRQNMKKDFDWIV